MTDMSRGFKKINMVELSNILEKHQGEKVQHIFYRILDDPGFQRKEKLTEDLIQYLLDKSKDRKIVYYDIWETGHKIINISTYSGDETISITFYK